MDSNSFFDLLSNIIDLAKTVEKIPNQTNRHIDELTTVVEFHVVGTLFAYTWDSEALLSARSSNRKCVLRGIQ